MKYNRFSKGVHLYYNYDLSDYCDVEMESYSFYQGLAMLQRSLLDGWTIIGLGSESGAVAVHLV